MVSPSDSVSTVNSGDVTEGDVTEGDVTDAVADVPDVPDVPDVARDVGGVFVVHARLGRGKRCGRLLVVTGSMSSALGNTPRFLG